MFLSYDGLESLQAVLTYMIIYNLSLVTLFFTLFQFMILNLKTLASFTTLGSQNILTKVLVLIILSMAGVPPFTGFFAKMLLFILLLNIKFSFVFLLFFSLLLVALYFYLQNMRFLNAAAPSSFLPLNDFQLQLSPVYYYVALTNSFLLLFGILLFEDFLLFTYWLIV